jgi:serine/threonine-protein kinase
VNVAEERGPVRVVGRYALYNEIAAGGMATVHFGRLLGPVGFSRTVAIKRLHPQFAKDPEFVSMFLDEARLAARIRHPNVVPTLDVVATQGELFLVMDYVQGESLSRLIRAARERHERIPVKFLGAIVGGALHGLHAAHEAKNERGEPLHIVHRDISPQNILVGTDGVARVLDFGVAKAAGRVQTTREGQLKGKLAYMAPEQISGQVTRQTDVFAAAIVLWEALTAQRLFTGDNEGQILSKLLSGLVQPPSAVVPELPVQLDEVVLRGLAREPAHRYATAREFAIALERCVGVASATEVGDWVESMAHSALAQRAERIAEIESSSANVAPNDGHTHVSPPIDHPVSQASQLSSLSVSKPVQPRASNRTLIGVIIALLSLVLGGIVVFVVLVLSRGAPTVASPSPSASVAASAPPEQPLQPLVVATATQAAPPPPTTTPTVTVAPTPTRAPRRPEPPTVTAPPPQKNCDPPYTLDPRGHKIWKPECM